MSTKPCPQCGQRSNDGHLCHICTSRLRVRLTHAVEPSVATLWPVLQETVTRRDRLTQPSEVHADTIHGPLPFKDHASRVADDVRGKLLGWVRIAIDDLGADCPADDPVAWCHLLARMLPRWRTHEGAVDFWREVWIMPTAMLAAMDYPEERARIPAGPCPEHTEDQEPCPGQVVSIFPADQAIPPRAECTPRSKGDPVCGRVWPSTEWAGLGLAILVREAQIARQQQRGRTPTPTRDQWQKPDGRRDLIDVLDAAALYGVPMGTLRQWMSAGVVVRHRVIGVDADLIDPRDVRRELGRHAVGKITG